MSTLVTTNRSTTTRSSTAGRPASEGVRPSIDLVAELTTAPASLGDISCWRLLTARVPLTLLLDLSLPVEELGAVHDEMLAEPTSVDWVPAPRR